MCFKGTCVILKSYVSQIKVLSPLRFFCRVDVILKFIIFRELNDLFQKLITSYFKKFYEKVFRHVHLRQSQETLLATNRQIGSSYTSETFHQSKSIILMCFCQIPYLKSSLITRHKSFWMRSLKSIRNSGQILKKILNYFSQYMSWTDH